MHEERIRQIVGERERSRYKAEQFVREVRNLPPMVVGGTRARLGELSLGDGFIGYELEFKDQGKPAEYHGIRDHNPPILVPDPSGPVVRDYGDRVERYREDTQGALDAMVREYIRLRSKGLLYGTDTFYSSLSGNAYSEHATYSTARAGSTLLTDTTNPFAWGQLNTGPPWDFYCTYFGFDTSAIPDTNNISAAVLSLYGAASSFSFKNASGDVIRIRVVDYGASIGTEDYIAGASLSAAGTLVATFSSAWSISAYNDFTDVAMPANVNKTGTTKLLMHVKFAEDGTVNSSGGVVHGQDETGTTKDPKLVVTHSAPGGGGERSQAIIIG